MRFGGAPYNICDTNYINLKRHESRITFFFCRFQDVVHGADKYKRKHTYVVKAVVNPWYRAVHT